MLVEDSQDTELVRDAYYGSPQSLHQDTKELEEVSQPKSLARPNQDISILGSPLNTENYERLLSI